MTRQSGVALVVRPQNRDFITEVTKQMRHVHDIPKLLLKFKKGEAFHAEWLKLYTTLDAGLPIVDMIHSFVNEDVDRDEADKEFLSTLLSQFNLHDPHSIFHQLQCAIDFDASGTSDCSTSSSSATVLKDGYDACLDQHRSTFESLELQLTRAGHRVLEMVPLLQNVCVEYISQV